MNPWKRRAAQSKGGIKGGRKGGLSCHRQHPELARANVLRQWATRRAREAEEQAQHAEGGGDGHDQ